jgi:hypothetical protein
MKLIHPNRMPVRQWTLTIAAAALALTAFATAPTPAKATSPVKIAVFDFELEDFSAGGPLAGESPAETERLKMVTTEARRLLAQSGRYDLVDVNATDSLTAKQHGLHTCNGCDADIAKALGADQSFLGVIHKVSVLLHAVNFQIRDTRTGKLIRNLQADFRGDTDEAWRRAVVWLIKNKLLEDGQPANQPVQSQ